jgi:CHASE2 domain-containing sensor protein
MRQLVKVIWPDIKAKGLRYWLFAAGFIAAALLASSYINRNYLILGPRYAAYQMLQGTTPGTIRYAQRVVLVVVGDAEFWKGELDHRVPVKRDYLAKLVDVLDAANPEVLAIDFVLRSPVADGSVVETPVYWQETEKLIDAIERAKNGTIVLPETVNEYSYDKGTESYILDSSILDRHKFLTDRIRWGYLNLRRDVRQIPLAVQIRGGGRSQVSSFSQQIVGILDPQNSAVRRSQATLFGSFMPIDGFITIPANQVLADPTGSWRTKVQHRAVIIGSFVHEDAYFRGPYLDPAKTPVGDVPGVAVHANYVEALYRGRVYPVSPSLVSDSIELLLSISVSVLLARRIGKFRKSAYFICALTCAFIVSYVLLQNLAVFFDPVLPVLGAALHSLLERVLGPHHAF